MTVYNSLLGNEILGKESVARSRDIGTAVLQTPISRQRPDKHNANNVTIGASFLWGPCRGVIAEIIAADSSVSKRMGRHSVS
jgi:hypothetical protein